MDCQIPIMIPSKNRFGKTKTDKLLKEVGIPFCFVVEKEDAENYASLGHPIMILEKSNQGISYARDFILRSMRKLNYEYFWMLDDDIESFGEVKNGKTVRTDATVLNQAYEQLKIYGDTSLYSLELCQFAWSSKDVSKNKIAMQCVLFDMKNCNNIDYDLRIKIREDYDLSFQAIFKAKGTLKSGKYFYSIAEMKSQSGGMEQWYNEKTELIETSKLCQKWPKIVEPIRKKNRIDVKINWSLIK